MAWAVLPAALIAAPLSAQETNAATASPPAASPTEIGPGELSNFSLNGTVTRPADKPIAPATSTRTARPVQAPAAAATVQRPPAEPREETPARRASPNRDLFKRPPTLPSASPSATIGGAPAFPEVSAPASTVPAPATSGFSPLPWIVALLAAAGLAVMLFGLQRRRQQLRPAGPSPTGVIEPVPAPHHAPRVASPASPQPNGRRPLPTTLLPQQPTPHADAPAPGLIVSTGLRPWLDVELSPDRALVDEQGAAIAFDVTLFNSGSAPARDVIVEARLLNAGARQDEELSAFFTANSQVGDPIPQIAPFARIPLRSAVRLPREAIREYEYEGRKLFMPMVAISVRYRWSSGEGQSAAGFLVGQGGSAEQKLAPLRLDRGSRSWAGLGVRRYEKGLRT